MQLFLTSTGLPPETSSFFLKLLDRPTKDYTVAFIPTAGDPYDDKWFVKEDLDRLKELGFQVNTVDLKQDKQVIQELLINSQIVYVAGGNTFYLLDWVKKSGLDSYLKRLLDHGRIYIGASAGSILAGPDIKSSSWGNGGDKNDVKLKDTKGLNLVPFVIHPHFTDKNRPILQKHLSKIKYDIIPITDSQAIYYHDGDWQLVGEGEKISLTKK
jgi:dipeptidase E